MLTGLFLVFWVVPQCAYSEPLGTEGVVLERKVPVGGLLASGRQAVDRLARNQPPTPSTPAATGKSWGKRHPVLTGALVGAGIGAALGAAACPSDADRWPGVMASAGAGYGFGFGAVAGWLISR